MQSLTQREFEIMRLLEQGYKVKYIAHSLFLAEETILNHLQHIYDKFEIEPKDETYNRKTRSIYLFKKYKNEQVLKHFENIKQNIIKVLDSCTDYFKEEVE